MKKNRFLAVLLTALIFAGNMWAETAPKREFRAAWVATVMNIDWPKQKGTSASVIAAQKADLITMLDAMEDLNLTTLCFQVRSMSDAMYKSSYEPWSSYLTGTRGTDPGWDPLAFMVEESHKRGIEVYAWVNPFRWASSGSSTYWTTSFDTQVKNKGWLMTNGSYTVLNPALTDVRAHIVNVCKEIISNYDVEGMIFDDYFYPSGGTSEGSDAPDYSLWKSANSGMTIGDWRRNNVNTAIKEIYDMIQATRPEVRFGIAPPGTAGESASKYGLTMCPAGYDGQYKSLYADPLYWMANHIIDFMSPQVYWHNDHKLAKFGPLANWWYGCTAKLKNVHCSMSVNVYDLATSMGSQADLGNTTAHYDEHVTNIKQSREYAAAHGLNAFGSNFYSVQYLYGTYAKHGNYLRDNCFQTKALVPVVDWKTIPTYSAVSNLKYSSGNLSWTAVNAGKSTMRYSVYAVPGTIEIEDAQASDGDGIDQQYLLGVSYANSYTIPTEKQSGYWYAVCVYDGYGKEHEAAYAGYSMEPSAKVTLTSPVNGASAQWSQKFSWSAVSGATYRLDIASDNSFTDIKYQEYNLTSNSKTLDLYLLDSSKTYYWRVLCTEDGKQSTTSDVATFTSPKRTAAPAATLVSPANAAQIDEDITFSWKATSGMDYTLEVSASSDFSTIKYSKNVSATTTGTLSQDVAISQFHKGTFYWRIVSAGKYYTDTNSAVRTFEVTKETVGLYESGYEVVTDKDNDTYEQMDNISVNSLWFRSVATEYGNITFDGEGGTFNRGMCAVGDYVYVSGRSANDYNSSTKVYLRKFNGKTGEIMGDIVLGSESLLYYNPCNDVIKDSNGSVCITNLVLSPASNPLKIHKVNLETGALTEVASIKLSDVTGTRIDNVALYGDVTTGNFKVFAAIPSTKHIVCWTFANGTQTSQTYCTVNSFYPEGQANFGIAPRVLPIDGNSLFVDGANTAWSRYDLSSGKMTDSFLNNGLLAPSSFKVNGGTYFTIGGKNFMTYSLSDWSSSIPNAFNVVSVDSNLSFASMNKMWTLPKVGMGSVQNMGQQAIADYVQVDNNSVILYYYVPGNGICAYEIVDNYATGVDGLNAQEGVKIKAENGSIALSAEAQSIDVYSVMGAKVAHAENATEVKVAADSGMYIVVAVVDGEVYTKKILVK